MQTEKTESLADLIRRIQKSELPLAEESAVFEQIKEKHERGETFTPKEQDLILRLAKRARDWENSVESSANTMPEDTLPGC